MKTKQNKSFIAIITACVISMQAASAAVTQFSGTFSVTFSSTPGFGQTFQGISSMQGTWSFNFDQSVVPNTGSYSPPADISLQTLSLTPSTIGVTSFGLANTKATLNYFNGSLTGLVIGGDADFVNGLNTSTLADFSVGYLGSGVADSSGINNAGISGFQFGSASGSFTSVPEPGASIICLGGVAFFVLRRRSRN